MNEPTCQRIRAHFPDFCGGRGITRNLEYFSTLINIFPSMGTYTRVSPDLELYRVSSWSKFIFEMCTAFGFAKRGEMKIKIKTNSQKLRTSAAARENLLISPSHAFKTLRVRMSQNTKCNHMHLNFLWDL